MPKPISWQIKLTGWLPSRLAIYTFRRLRNNIFFTPSKMTFTLEVLQLNLYFIKQNVFNELCYWLCLMDPGACMLTDFGLILCLHCLHLTLCLLQRFSCYILKDEYGSSLLFKEVTSCSSVGMTYAQLGQHWNKMRDQFSVLLMYT